MFVMVFIDGVQKTLTHTAFGEAAVRVELARLGVKDRYGVAACPTNTHVLSCRDIVSKDGHTVTQVRMEECI